MDAISLNGARQTNICLGFTVVREEAAPVVGVVARLDSADLLEEDGRGSDMEPGVASKDCVSSNLVSRVQEVSGNYKPQKQCKCKPEDQHPEDGWLFLALGPSLVLDPLVERTQAGCQQLEVQAQLVWCHLLLGSSSFGSLQHATRRWE